jgi:hypothetical protein
VAPKPAVDPGGLGSEYVIVEVTVGSEHKPTYLSQYRCSVAVIVVGQFPEKEAHVGAYHLLVAGNGGTFKCDRWRVAIMPNTGAALSGMFG